MIYFYQSAFEFQAQLLFPQFFEKAKVLDFELGPNGLWLKIAMSNKPKREAFQHMALDQIPIGIAVGIANAWSNNGKDAALKYAKDAAEQIRNTMAAEQAAKRKA